MNKRQSKTSPELSEEDDSLTTQKSLNSSQSSLKKANSPPANPIEIPPNKQPTVM